MVFDWTISLGNILTITGFFISGIAFILFMRSDLLVLAARVSHVEAAMRELVQANLALAEQKGRMEQIDERVNRITDRVDTLIAAQFVGNHTK